MKCIGCISMTIWHFPMDVLVKNIFLNNMEASNLIQCLPMPIDEMQIVRSFLCSV